MYSNANILGSYLSKTTVKLPKLKHLWACLGFGWSVSCWFPFQNYIRGHKLETRVLFLGDMFNGLVPTHGGVPVGDPSAHSTGWASPSLPQFQGYLPFPFFPGIRIFSGSHQKPISFNGSDFFVEERWLKRRVEGINPKPKALEFEGLGSTSLPWPQFSSVF